jgi:broad specificity phosphatase PhoE
MIYLVRHGQTDWNLARKIQGRIDTSINEKGLEQALAMRDKLSDVKFSAAYSSPLMRTYTTAQAIYNGEIIKDDRLIERDFGKMEGEPLMTEQFCNMWQYGFENCNEDVESIETVAERLKSFFEDLKKCNNDEDILVVTHGGVIMIAMLLVSGVPQSKNLLEYLPTNGECIKFDLKSLELEVVL